MGRSYLIFLMFLFLVTFSEFLHAQTVELSGVVYGNDDVENIHVINRTSKMFTTTNNMGIFKISAKYQDTIQFTSVQYKTSIIVVSYITIQEKSLKVYLEEQINVLDEVIVGKVLTGDLNSDIENSDAERPIDFYDLGLPGYKGKPKTQSERRLYDADHGKYFYYYGLGFSINVHKILNKISGRTKKLEDRVIFEKKNEILLKLIFSYSDILFTNLDLEDSKRIEFFYYCSEHDQFLRICENTYSIETLQFLQFRLDEYLLNLKSRKN